MDRRDLAARENPSWQQVNLLALMTQLFPYDAGPYTLQEIASLLASSYGQRITYGKVNRALVALTRNEHTREQVAPMDAGARYYEFSSEAARRIARRVVKGRLPLESGIKRLEANSSAAPDVLPLARHWGGRESKPR